MTAVAMSVNGKPVTADVEPRMLLVQFLREHLRLTGTHVGCDTSQPVNPYRAISRVQLPQFRS